MSLLRLDKDAVAPGDPMFHPIISNSSHVRYYGMSGWRYCGSCCFHLCIHVLLCSSSPHNHTTLHFTERTPSGCDDRVISLCLRLRVERDDPQSETNPQRRCFARGLRSAIHLGGGPGTLYDPIPLGDDRPIKPGLTLARTSWRCYGGPRSSDSMKFPKVSKH